MKSRLIKPRAPRRYAFWVFSVAFFFSLTSCHDDHPTSVPEPQTAAKTILMFLPFSGDDNNNYNLYNNFQQNISDIEQVMVNNGGIGNRRLLVCISLSATRAALVDLVYDKGKCRRDTLRRYSHPALTTAEGLATIFNDMKAVAPADQYALIVGCHGEGWLPARRNAMPPTTRHFGGLSSQHQIETSTLARAVNMAGLKFQFMLFDVCYFSTIEVAYDLRHATDHLIASTSEIMAYGMPYQQMLPSLLKDSPDYDAVCQQFLHFYENYYSSGKPMPYGTLAVTDLRQMDNMVETMREINRQCSFDDALLNQLQDLDAGHWEPTIYFDFGDYVQRLCHNRDDLHEAFKTSLSKLVISKVATENIYSAAGKKVLKINRFSGLSISDPSVNEQATASKQQTPWWKATH